MNISDLIPQALRDKANAILDTSEALLQGETARAIGYGGGLVLFLVAKAFAVIPDQSLPEALAQGIAAEGVVALLIEPIRHYVSSPATAARLIDEATDARVGSGVG